MINQKYLYHFTENQIIEKEQIEESKNEQGELVKTIKTLKEDKPVEFAIKKPNRVLFDEAELFYGVKLADAIKAGMLTKTLMIKKYDKDGGIFTENELERVKGTLEELGRIQSSIDILNKKEENKETLTEDEIKEKVDFEAQIKSLRLELVDIENSKNSLFEQTAEHRARNKIMMWWVLQLSYRKDGDIYTPLFNDGSYDQKLKKYDEIEEGDDDFMKSIVTKFAYFISFWYAGKASKQEEFKVIEDYLKGETGA